MSRDNATTSADGFTRTHSTRLVFSLIVGLIAALAMVIVTFAAQPAEAATNSVKKCGGGQITLSEKEAKMFRLHNQTRASRDIPRLCIHPKLQKAARAHSRDMIRRNYFAHDTKGSNKTFSQRLRAYGYNWRLCAENLTWGSGYKGKPANRFRSWMDSPQHRPNILDRRMREVGIGVATGTFQGSSNASVYTADFGVR